MTFQGENPNTLIFGDVDHIDPFGKHARHDDIGGSTATIEQSVPILVLLTPGHMTVQGDNLYHNVYFLY